MPDDPSPGRPRVVGAPEDGVRFVDGAGASADEVVALIHVALDSLASGSVLMVHSDADGFDDHLAALCSLRRVDWVATVSHVDRGRSYTLRT